MKIQKPFIPDVEIFTDGACDPNPGIGGWGVVMKWTSSNKVKRFSGATPNSTNNRMELTAVIQALKKLVYPQNVEVISDSTYVIDANTKGWLKNWHELGQLTVTGSRLNADLWLELISVAKPHNIVWTWIRGHVGHPDNEMADYLAVLARKKLRDTLMDSTVGRK